MAILMDTTEWTAAIRGYERASRKTFVEVVHHMLGKVGFEGARIAKKLMPNRASVSGLRDQVRLVTWLARRRFGTAPRVSRMYRTARKVTKPNKRGQMVTRSYKSKARVRRAPTSFTREEAQELAKKHFGRRASSVGFLRNWFRTWQAYFIVPGSDPWRGANQKSGFVVRVQRAGERQHVAAIAISYDYRSPLVGAPASRAARADRVLQRVLNFAQASAIRDAQVYIDRKAKGDADRFSARGAA